MSIIPELDYKQVCRRILFPIYRLSGGDISYQDGILFEGNKVLDDRNQPGATLGERRLQTPHDCSRLGDTVFDFVELLGNLKSNNFIDSKGVCFKYVKTKMCRVVSYKIKKKISKDTYTILILQGITYLFINNYYPKAEEWGQVLMLGNLPWKLVSLSEEQLKTYRRKI